MKNSIKYLKQIFNILIWPIVFMIGQFVIQLIFILIFNLNEKINYTNSEFANYIKSKKYSLELNNYISSKALIIAFITTIIFLPIFYNIIKKYKKKSNFKFKNILIPALLGITISLIYNIAVFNLNNIFEFTNQYKLSDMNLLIQIICSGICGPILEELLFRGIVYNKLKKIVKPITAIIQTSIIFAIMHTSIINMIYAFGVSFIFIYLYETYKTLKAPIIMHMVLNITTILMVPLIIRNFYVFNYYLLFVSIIVLLFIKKNIK